MTAHYVYRVFDHEGRLIYIGRTRDLVARLKKHRTRSWWVGQAAKVTAQVYPHKNTAHFEEMCAIRSETPRWNIVGRMMPRTEAERADLALAKLHRRSEARRSA